MANLKVEKITNHYTNNNTNRLRIHSRSNPAIATAAAGHSKAKNVPQRGMRQAGGSAGLKRCHSCCYPGWRMPAGNDNRTRKKSKQRAAAPAAAAAPLLTDQQRSCRMCNYADMREPGVRCRNNPAGAENVLVLRNCDECHDYELVACDPRDNINPVPQAILDAIKRRKEKELREQLASERREQRLRRKQQRNSSLSKSRLSPLPNADRKSGGKSDMEYCQLCGVLVDDTCNTEHGICTACSRKIRYVVNNYMDSGTASSKAANNADAQLADSRQAPPGRALDTNDGPSFSVIVLPDRDNDSLIEHLTSAINRSRSNLNPATQAGRTSLTSKTKRSSVSQSARPSLDTAYRPEQPRNSNGRVSISRYANGEYRSSFGQRSPVLNPANYNTNAYDAPAPQDGSSLARNENMLDGRYDGRMWPMCNPRICPKRRTMRTADEGERAASRCGCCKQQAQDKLNISSLLAQALQIFIDKYTGAELEKEHARARKKRSNSTISSAGRQKSDILSINGSKRGVKMNSEGAAAEGGAGKKNRKVRRHSKKLPKANSVIVCPCCNAKIRNGTAKCENQANNGATAGQATGKEGASRSEYAAMAKHNAAAPNLDYTYNRTTKATWAGHAQSTTTSQHQHQQHQPHQHQQAGLHEAAPGRCDGACAGMSRPNRQPPNQNQPGLFKGPPRGCGCGGGGGGNAAYIRRQGGANVVQQVSTATLKTKPNVSYPIAHYRPGVISWPLHYLLASNAARRTLVRTAAGVTTYQKSFDCHVKPAAQGCLDKRTKSFASFAGIGRT